MGTTDLDLLTDPAARAARRLADRGAHGVEQHRVLDVDADLSELAGLLYLNRRQRWAVATPRVRKTGASLRVVATNPLLPHDAVDAAQQWAAQVLHRRAPSIDGWSPATVLDQTGYIPATPLEAGPAVRQTPQSLSETNRHRCFTSPVTFTPAPTVFKRDWSLQVGIFYDAGFEKRLNTYFETCHSRRQRLSLHGLHDAVRWHLHHELDLPMAACDLGERHWFHQQETPHRMVEAVLTGAAITTHATIQHSSHDHGEVAFAVKVLDTAVTAGLDAVALIAGTPLLVPLVQRLREHGVFVLVPRIDVDCTGKDHHKAHLVRTAFPLVQQSTSSPTYHELIEPGLLAGSRLAFPFQCNLPTPVPAADAADADPMSVRVGVISQWELGVTNGFITESGTGRPWFASHRHTPQYAGLQPGTRVTFTGDPQSAELGTRPKARHITPVTEHELFVPQPQRRETITDALSWLPGPCDGEPS